MASRTDLHKVLVSLLGSNNVYYQPPATMEYPCILYSRVGLDTVKADDANYLTNKEYEVIVISKTPDLPVIEKILALPMASYDRQYKADNLYHDVLTLYY